MEDLSVKQAVDDVAQGARCDQRDADEHAELGAFFREVKQRVKQGDHGQNSENAQQGLDDAAVAHHAESHAVVLDEQQLEPVAKQGNLLPDGHVRLDPDLEDLVENQDNGDDDQGAGEAFVFCLSHFFLFSFILASRQMVVVGTQRSLSLGISLPVARQMP